MNSDMLGLIELLLVLGIVLGLAVWELVSLRRAQRDERLRAASDAPPPGTTNRGRMPR